MYERWKRDESGGLIDTLSERNERLAWSMRNGRHFRLINGELLEGREERIAADLRELMQIGRPQWKGGMRELAMQGVPLGAEGTYGALGAYPLPTALAAVTPTTTESGLLTAAQGALYMPIPANGLLAPQAYRFVAAGVCTTSVTAANYTWSARLGNVLTSPSMGISAALAKTVSLTNATWVMKGDLTVQSIGPPGTNARAIGTFQMLLNSAVGGAFTGWSWSTGVTPTSFDSTVAPGASANGGQIWLGVLASAAAADTFTVQQIHFMDWN